jgi:hypothetical protein
LNQNNNVTLRHQSLIHRIPRLGTGGLKNKISQVTQLIRNFVQLKKINTFMCQKIENYPSEPKNEFGLQNKYGRVMNLSMGNFLWSMKNFTFGGQKGENKPSKP